MYWPLAYTIRVKHPGKNYVSRAIVQEDGALWALATVWLSPVPLWHLLALALLLLSFWCIYEQGYKENDCYALRYEGAFGNVPLAYRDVPSGEPWAWLWALALGGIGVGTLAWATSASAWGGLESLAGWFAMLGFTRGVFRLYNTLTPSTRAPVYLLLQACRSFAALAVVAASVDGVFVLGAHVLARSAPYYLYRWSGQLVRIDWPYVPVFSIRVCIFLLLLIGYATGQRDVSVFLSPQFAVMLLWCLFRARRELRDMARNAAFIDASRGP